MSLALEQAKRTLGNTKENPAVGCVIVRNNNVIGAGYTSFNGRPHAEINAINFSKANLKNANLYVTLEPCSHYGKTPPCINNIMKKKIKKVFFAMKDPDHRSFNKSMNKLNRKGIAVCSGILNNKTKYFYRSYLKFKKKDLPFVTCKLAVSKDFFTITANTNKWITNQYSRGRVQLMRSNHDCIITSSRTISMDNPSLTCRIEGLRARSPTRIVLDKKLRIPIHSTIINDSHKNKTIIFYNKNNKKKIKVLKKLKLKMFRIRLDENGNLDLREALMKAKKLGLSRVFLETGLTLTLSFLKKNLIDDFELFVSGKKLGKKGKKNIKK